MKKIFSLCAVMLGVMALVCTGCKKEDQTKIEVDGFISVAVDSTKTITAKITPEVAGAQVSFTSNNANVKLVSNGLSCAVTGVKTGNSIITAAYNGKEATCSVTISGGSSYPVLQGEDYFAFFMDGTTAASLGAKLKYDFGPNDQNRWLYIWEKTLAPSTAEGNNPFGLAEGWPCMTQTDEKDWAGGGFCVAIKGDEDVYKEAADADLVALNSIATTINGEYDKWDLVISMKKSQQGVGYECHLIGGNVTGEALGEGIVKINDINCPADGRWHTLSFPLDQIAGLEFGQWENYGSNLFTIVANPFVVNGDLNLGTAFIYKAR